MTVVVPVTTTPAEWPKIATVEGVKAHLAIPEADTRDDALIAESIDAVTALLVGWGRTPSRVDDDEAAEVVYRWRDDWALGGKMLAARLVRRRNSPAGVDSIGDLGAVYIQRNDPDIADLLQIGRDLTPQVG